MERAKEGVWKNRQYNRETIKENEIVSELGWKNDIAKTTEKNSDDERVYETAVTDYLYLVW